MTALPPTGGTRRGAHRAPPVWHPNAPRGTCRHCGKPCKPHARSHSSCTAAWRANANYRQTDIRAAADAGTEPQCSYCGNRNLAELQDDHEVPLRDGGPHEWRVWRCAHNDNCPGSHHKKTAAENSRRAAAKRGRKMPAPTRKRRSGGKKPSPAAATATIASPPPVDPLEPPPWMPPWIRTYLATGVMIGCLFWIITALLGHSGPRFFLGFVVAWCVLAVAVTVYGRRRHVRRAALIRARDIVAMHMNQPSEKVRARARGWLRIEDVWVPLPLEVRYSYLVQDDNEGMQSAVQQAVERCFGVEVDCQWSTVSNRLLISVAADAGWDETDEADDEDPAEGDTGPTAEHPEGPTEEPELDPVEQARRAVEAGVAKVVASQVKVAVHAVGREESGDPCPIELAIQFEPVASVHVVEKRAEVDEKVSSLLGANWNAQWGRQVVHYRLQSPIPERADLPKAEPSAHAQELAEEILGIVEQANAEGADEQQEIPVLPSIANVPTGAADTFIFGTPDKCPLGPNGAGGISSWSPEHFPHVLVSGATGTGKSTVFHLLSLWAHEHGWWQVPLDGKGTKLAGMRAWPSVVAFGMADPDTAVHLAGGIRWLHRLMKVRYGKITKGRPKVKPWQFPKMFIPLDELAELLDELNSAWTNGEDVWEDGDADQYTKRTGDHPAVGMLRSLARLARECRMHMAVGTQQANSKQFKGTEARDNYMGRLGLGALPDEASRMMFRKIGIGADIPPRLKGRGTWQSGEGPLERVQIYFVPEPDVDGEYSDDRDYPAKGLSGAEKWKIVEPFFGDRPPAIGARNTSGYLPPEGSVIWEFLTTPGEEPPEEMLRLVSAADAEAATVERKRKRREVTELSASDLAEMIDRAPEGGWVVVDDGAEGEMRNRVISGIEADPEVVTITWKVPGQVDTETIDWEPDTMFALAAPLEVE